MKHYLRIWGAGPNAVTLEGGGVVAIPIGTIYTFTALGKISIMLNDTAIITGELISTRETKKVKRSNRHNEVVTVGAFSVGREQ